MLTDMSTRQRVERNLLAGIAVGCALVCVLAAVALVTGVLYTMHDRVLVVVWISGILGLATSVAACRVEDDSTDDPAYFASIIEGLRKEWQRS
jgi:hypothetical protein